MKKLKTIVGVILRLFAVLLPGLYTGFALWKIHGALVTILAALGVEFIDSHNHYTSRSIKGIMPSDFIIS